MYTVLLSGGSGKRLWPLSNALRSKQYIRLLHDERTGGACSMIQRVWGQLAASGLAHGSVICAGQSQVEIIRSQLGPVGIAVEPERRDTFPAVALSCAYLVDKLGARHSDVVCVIPVDPYTDDGYFETIKKLPEVLLSSGAQIALMGARPTEPSGKYGYIVPAQDCGAYVRVDSFREKPKEAEARELIEKGALWNCGVFCLRIGDILQRLEKYGAPSDYDSLYDQYGLLPRISFDYEVLEKAQSLAAVGFDGMWKDLGTWNALCEEMARPSVGNCLMDPGCQNTHVVNETAVPVVVSGVKDVIIVASHDGILVSDKASTPQLKDLVKDLNGPPMYEERRWGVIRTLDLVMQADGGYGVTRRVEVFKGHNLSYHCHPFRDEVWTVLSGVGEFALEGIRREIAPGDSVRIGRGMYHSVLAKTNLVLMEVQVGEDAAGEADKLRIGFGWKQIRRLCAGGEKTADTRRETAVPDGFAAKGIPG